MKGNFVVVLHWAPWHEQTHVAAAVHLHAPLTSASYKMSDGCHSQCGNSEFSSSAKKLNPDATAGQYINQSLCIWVHFTSLQPLHFTTITSLHTTITSLHYNHFTSHYNHFTSLQSLHFTSVDPLLPTGVEGKLTWLYLIIKITSLRFDRKWA